MQRLGVALFVALDVVLDVAARCTAGTGATPAAFYLGLCRLRGVLFPPAPHDFAAGGPFFAAATTAAGGTVLLCDEENWSRTRRRCDYDCCRPNCSTLRRRKLESDAVRYCGRDRCHSGGFLLRIMPPSWHPVPACTPPLCSKRAVFLCGDEE